MRAKLQSLQSLMNTLLSIKAFNNEIFISKAKEFICYLPFVGPIKNLQFLQSSIVI